MNEFASVFLTFIVMISGATALSGLSYMNGITFGESVMRDQVVIYCNEKPKLCKEEYDNLKAQMKVNSYEKPNLEEL